MNLDPKALEAAYMSMYNLYSVEGNISMVDSARVCVTTYLTAAQADGWMPIGSAPIPTEKA